MNFGEELKTSETIVCSKRSSRDSKDADILEPALRKLKSIFTYRCAPGPRCRWCDRSIILIRADGLTAKLRAAARIELPRSPAPKLGAAHHGAKMRRPVAKMRQASREAGERMPSQPGCRLARTPTTRPGPVRAAATRLSRSWPEEPKEPETRRILTSPRSCLVGVERHDGPLPEVEASRQPPMTTADRS
jgi:hypothetical protein